MTTSFDAAIAQARTQQDVQQRADGILQSIEAQLTAAANDKGKQQEFLAAFKSQRSTLANTIAHG